MAPGAIPVCLCGGSAEMIGPAEEHLPVGLCPLIKSTYGFHLKKANPFLEIPDLLVVGTTCDGKKKMYELMGLRRRMHVIELPQKPDDPDAMAHWLSQLQVLKDRLEEEFGVRINESDLRNAISLWPGWVEQAADRCNSCHKPWKGPPSNCGQDHYRDHSPGNRCQEPYARHQDDHRHRWAG